MENATNETEVKKPKVKLTGNDGNVFNLVGICAKALRLDGQADKAEEMTTKVFGASSYDEALVIMGEYCEIR